MSAETLYTVQTSDISDDECPPPPELVAPNLVVMNKNLHDEFVSTKKQKACSDDDRFKRPRSASDMNELSKLQ